MKTEHFPHRSKRSIKGLNQMIDYINQYIPVKNFVIFEIGAWLGDATIEFAKRFDHVITVDPFVSGIGDITNNFDMEAVYKVFLDNIRDYSNITHWRNYSDEILSKVKTISVVYIDALHDYESVKKDIQVWSKKLRKGGFLCGHDFNDKHPGVMKAVKEFAKGQEIIQFCDSSWIVRV